MERLTIKPGICMNASTEYCESQEDCYLCPHGKQMRFRLSDYEDTGLTPEEIKAEQGWISVQERLPEHNKRCIFFSESNRTAHTGMLHHIGARGAVWFVTDKRYSVQYTAKWWMPLPEPPKEVSE